MDAAEKALRKTVRSSAPAYMDKVVTREQRKKERREGLSKARKVAAVAEIKADQPLEGKLYAQPQPQPQPQRQRKPILRIGKRLD